MYVVSYEYLYPFSEDILIVKSDEGEVLVFLESLSKYLYGGNDYSKHNLYKDICTNYNEIYQDTYSLYPYDMNEEVSNVVYKDLLCKKNKHFLPLMTTLEYLTKKTNNPNSISIKVLVKVLNDLFDYEVYINKKKSNNTNSKNNLINDLNNKEKDLLDTIYNKTLTSGYSKYIDHNYAKEEETIVKDFIFNKYENFKNKTLTNVDSFDKYMEKEDKEIKKEYMLNKISMDEYMENIRSSLKSLENDLWKLVDDVCNLEDYLMYSEDQLVNKD